MVCKKKKIAIFSIWVLVNSCAPNVETVPGVYIDNKSSSPDTLIINVNNRYVHRAVINSTHRTQMGRWAYKAGQLSLADYIFFEKDTAKKYMWIGEVETQNDSMHIVINSDTEESYVKIH